MSTSPTQLPASDDGGELPESLLRKLKIEIPGYQILREIDSGGQATVYRARELTSDFTVAIKVLHSGPYADDASRERFRRETNALKALNHPNIVTVIESGRTLAGLDYLVMNFVDGEPLDALWKDRKFAAKFFPEPPARLRLFKQICDIVQAAHRKGITHRDLSPCNILLDQGGQPHVLDFGLAATAFDALHAPNGRNITVTGQFIGKLQYASPEQAKGSRDAIDIRSDVYSLGVILYQILTNGAFPYIVVGNVVDILNNIIHSKPLPPSAVLEARNAPTLSVTPGKPRPVRKGPPLVNETIEAVVLKALEKEPASRYESAGTLAGDIELYLEGKPTSASRSFSSNVNLAKTARRKVITAAAIVATASLTIGATMNSKSVASWLGLTAVLSSFGAGISPGIDPGIKLDVARTAYELAVQEARAQILKVIDDKDVELRTKGGSDEAIDKLKAQRADFMEKGEVPPGLPVRASLKAYEDQRKLLIAAYNTAADGYRDPRIKLDDLRTQTRNEAKVLATENDLLPWSTNLADAPDFAGHTLDASNPTYKLPTPVTDAYRVDVAGKTEGGGVVTIVVPTLDGKCVSLPVKVDGSGDFHAMLTVRAGSVGVDMGVDRQINPIETESGSQAAIRLSGGRASLKTVRMKSVLKKSLVASDFPNSSSDDKLARGMQPQDDKAKVRAAAVVEMKKGLKLRGRMNAQGNGGDTDVETTSVVLRADTSSFTLETTGSGGSVWQWDFEVTDDSITLKPGGFRRIRANTGIKNPLPPDGVTAMGTLLPGGIHFEFVWPQTPINFTGRFTLNVASKKRMSELFPKGSTWSGSWETPSVTEKTSAVVRSCTPTTALLAWRNERGNWEMTLELVDEEIRLKKLDPIGIGFKGQVLSKIVDIKVGGAADEAAQGGHVELTGVFGSRNSTSGIDSDNVRQRFVLIKD